MIDLMDCSPEGQPKIGRVRHVQMILSFFALFIYGMQYSSLSMVIVGMSDLPEYSFYGALNYTVAEKGTLSGMFVYGNMLMTLPAGYFACAYRPILIASVSGGILGGILTLLMPYVMYHHGFVAACAVRAIQGALQGFAMPCVYAHMSKWVIPRERGMFSWLWSGSPFGIGFSLAVGGIIIAHFGGWSSLYFFTGAVTLAWGIVCYMFGVETPGEHASISFTEREHIEKNLPMPPKVSIKWFKMFTSVPMWALLFTHGFDRWSTVLMTSLIATYLNDIFKFTVEQTGWMTGAFCVIASVSGFCYAFIGHKMSRFFSAEVSRRFWNSIGFYGPMMAFLIILFVDNNQTSVLLLVGLSNIFNPAKFLGVETNYHDLAPGLVGIVSAASVFFGNLIGFTSPIFAGLVIKDEKDPAEWLNVFGAVALANFLAGTIFLIFSSTKIQPWYEEG